MSSSDSNKSDNDEVDEEDPHHYHYHHHSHTHTYNFSGAYIGNVNNTNGGIVNVNPKPVSPAQDLFGVGSISYRPSSKKSAPLSPSAYHTPPPRPPLAQPPPLSHVHMTRTAVAASNPASVSEDRVEQSAKQIVVQETLEEMYNDKDNDSKSKGKASRKQEFRRGGMDGQGRRRKEDRDDGSSGDGYQGGSIRC